MSNIYFISDIDHVANKNKPVSIEVAIRNISKYILNKIDDNFSIELFNEWCHSDSERPFKYNSRVYYWSKKH